MIRLRRLPALALSLALSWGLAAAAWAAELKTAPLITVPSLLLGTAAQPSSPLWGALANQTLALQALSGPQAAAALKQSAYSPQPLEALSALALARAAAEPAAAQVLLEKQPGLAATIGFLKGVDGIHELAQAGKADKALAHFFDGASPDLGFSEIQAKGRSLKVGKQKLQFLGAGEFGAVYVHPKAEGAVIKAVEHGFQISVFDANRTVTDTADEEEVVSRALAEAGAGPRYLGRAVHQRRELSARERIYGETMQSLSRDRKFGAEEKQLVLDMIRRMAKAGLMTDDKRPPNIMIGRTLLDPRRRAYLIDGGKIIKVEPGVTEDELYERLVHQITIVTRRMDPHMGEIEISKPFSMMLDEAVHRSRPMTRWERLWDGFKSAFKYPPGVE